MIYSNQEETDTRVILYLHHAASLGYKEAVVRTPDTDIFVILLHHANTLDLTVHLDTGVGKQRKLINVSELAAELGEDYCETLLGFYVFTGEDCTSAFKGKGKVGPLKKLEKNPRFQNAFRQLGNDWVINEKLVKQLEHFTCLMYGQLREKNVDSARVKLLNRMVGEDKTLTSKSKIDLSRLPPCHSALRPHIERVNHRVCLFKQANQQIIEAPKPQDEHQGWEKTDSGILEPIWSYGTVLPTSLADLLDQSMTEQEEESNYDEDVEAEDELDIDGLSESDDE